jgi:hypothetical protein
MKTDRFYLEMLIFGAIPPTVFEITYQLTGFRGLGYVVGCMFGCALYVWIQSKNYTK